MNCGEKAESASPFIESEFALLVYWMTERESMRVKKARGMPKPWTDNPLLRDYRWCNVRRMDDRVSRWLINHWYDGIADSSQLLVAATLARLINWPDALAEVKPLFPSLTDVRAGLRSLKNAGRKIFTGAYVVPGVPGEEKIDSVMNVATLVAERARDIAKLASMRDTWSALTCFDGLGSFLAGQIVADLAFLEPGLGWPDRSVWAPVGPGSARGLNRLRGHPKDRTVSQEEFERFLPELCRQLRPRVDALWSDRDLVAMDIQNVLCETDKLRRLMLAEGKVRARYDGGNSQVQLL